jgi:hypothetical protein
MYRKIIVGYVPMSRQASGEVLSSEAAELLVSKAEEGVGIISITDAQRALRAVALIEPSGDSR